MLEQLEKVDGILMVKMEVYATVQTKVDADLIGYSVSVEPGNCQAKASGQMAILTMDDHTREQVRLINSDKDLQNEMLVSAQVVILEALLASARQDDNKNKKERAAPTQPGGSA